MPLRCSRRCSTASPAASCRALPRRRTPSTASASARSREHVDEFWRVGTEAGYQPDGEPGPRPQYGPDYYGGFLLDPDGNSAEAVHHDSVRQDGIVDHLWLRVSDVAVARDFYQRV